MGGRVAATVQQACTIPGNLFRGVGGEGEGVAYSFVARLSHLTIARTPRTPFETEHSSCS